MSSTTFNGPVASVNGFRFPVTTKADLPAVSAENAGTAYVVSDSGAGGDEYCIVISTGTAWVTATGTPLS
jgi:hypothetical protein